MTFVSVNEVQSGDRAAAKAAAWPTLYRRVYIAFGNLAREEGGPRLPASTDIAEMHPIRNALETYPGRRDNTVSKPLSCVDVPPRGCLGPKP